MGLLEVSAFFSGGRLEDLAVRLERPMPARLFVGQTPEMVGKTVPRLYTLCAQAQASAARAALAAAGGSEADFADPDPAALWAEALHEYFWRLLLDWPRLLGLAPAPAAFAAWRKQRGGGQLPAASRELLEEVLNPLAKNCQARIDSLGGTTESAKFDAPLLTPAEWLPYCRGERRMPRVAAPVSLAEAYRRRVRETENAVTALREGQPYPLASAGENGWGVGQVMTARGVLTHAAHLEQGRVLAYRVWAPTDCLFADAACLSALLAGNRWNSRESAEQGLELAVLALDPCLPFVVKVEA